VRRAKNLTTFHEPIVLKSGSLNLLEPSGLAKACNGIAFLNVSNIFCFVTQSSDVGKKTKKWLLHLCLFIMSVVIFALQITDFYSIL
jgi:hypothetical protein